jgi:UMF1 family MFS transporter
MFYALTDKGSSWIGPLIIAAVYAATGQVRWAILALMPLMIIGAILLFFVRVEKGEREAIEFSKTSHRA